jgi:hypothetical protein
VRPLFATTLSPYEEKFVLASVSGGLQTTASETQRLDRCFLSWFPATAIWFRQRRALSRKNTALVCLPPLREVSSVTRGEDRKL